MAEIVGGMTGALQGSITGVLNQGQNLLDRFFPPERRQELAAKLTKFATEKPKLASFLLSQIAISGVPLALFIVFTLGVFIFALVAALVIGLLGAILFTALCVGIALLVLLPTLFITSFAGAFIWLWGLGAYYLLKWFNQKDIPGIHTKEGEEGEESNGLLGGLDALNGEAKSPPPQGEKKEGKEEKSEKSEKKSNGVIGKVPGGDNVDKLGKSTGVDTGEVTKKADVNNVTKTADVGNVTNKVGAAKGAVPGGIL